MFNNIPGPESPFESLKIDEIEVEGLDEVAKERQAMVASLATISDEYDPLSDYSKMLQINRQRLDLAEEGRIQDEIRLKSIKSSASAYAMAASRNPEVTGQLNEALAARIQEENDRLYPIEQEASTRLSEMWGTADPSEIELFERSESVGAVGARIEMDRRKMVIMREIERAQIELEDRNMFFNAVDMAFFFAIPLLDATARTDNVPGDNPSLIEEVFSGGPHRRENASFMSMDLSPEEFDALVPQVIANIEKSTTDFGYKNKLQELAILSELVNTPSVITENAMNTLDASGVALAAFKGVRAVSKLPSALVSSGLRTEAAETMSGALKALKEGGEATSKKAFGISFDDIADEMPAKAVNPDKALDGSIGVGVDAASRYERGKGLAKELGLADLTELNRLQGDELEAALTKAREFYSKQLNRKIEDVEIINPTEGSGINTPVIRIFVGKRGGGLYASEQSALRAATKLGLQTPDVVIRAPKKSVGEKVVVKKANLLGADQDEAIQTARSYLGANKSDDIVIDPTRGELAALTNNGMSDVRILATKNGNIIAANADVYTHFTLADELGIPYKEMGRGFYNPRKVGRKEFFDFDKRYDSIRTFRSVDEDYYKLQGDTAPTPKPDGYRTSNNKFYPLDDNTLYVTKKALDTLRNSFKQGETRIAKDETGFMGAYSVFNIADDSPIKQSLVAVDTDPSKGLYPVRLSDEGKVVEFGEDITELVKGDTTRIPNPDKNIINKELDENISFRNKLRNINKGTDVTNDPVVSSQASAWGMNLNGFRTTLDTKIRELKKLLKETPDTVEQTKPNAPKGRVEKEAGGQYAIVFDAAVNEKGLFAPITDTKAYTPIGRYLLGGRQLASEDLFGLSVLSLARRNKIISILKNQIAPAFKPLNKKERKLLDKITLFGEQEARWFNKDELLSLVRTEIDKPATDERMWKAYTAFQDLNDIEYFLRNAELYSIKSTQGFSTVGFKLSDEVDVTANGRVYRDITTARPKGRIYNAEEQKTYPNGTKDQDFSAKTLRDNGFYLVELDKPMRLPDGSRTQNIVIKPSNLDQKPLKQTQINYRAGGHRIYGPRVKYFAKQAVIEVQPDTLEKYMMNPKTWIGGESVVDVRRWVDTMENARRQAVRWRAGELTDLGFKRIINKLLDEPGYPSTDEFIKGIDDGTIRLEEPFEVVYDREMPSAYYRGSFNTDMVDELPGNISNMDTVGRLYYSPKGSTLTDVKGQELPVLNLYETINKSLSNVANTVGMGPYKIRAMEKWVETYRPFLDDPSGSNAKMFGDAKFRKGVDGRIIAAALQERSVVKRVMNWTTEEDGFFQRTTRSIVEMVDEAAAPLPNAVREKINAPVNWMASGDLMHRMRGLVFDMKLGFFNAGQFPMQITTMLAASSIDSGKGFQAMMSLPVMRAYTSGGKVSRASAIEVINNIDPKVMGFKNADELIEMMDEMRNGGFLEVNSTHVLANDFNSTKAYNLTGNTAQDIREGGRFFFYEAERWNRSVAFNIAWRQVRKASPDLKTTSQDFLEAVYTKAEDLSMNMTEASSAAWQKGLASIPTQFFPYPVRILEALFGKQFTTSQKLRLFLSQAFLYGPAGTPFIAWASDKINGEKGEIAKFDEEPLKAFLDRGAIDAAIYMATAGEADVAFSRRAGTGHFWTDTIKELFNVGRYGDSSAVDNLGGATINVLGDTAADMGDVIKYAYAERGLGPLTENAFIGMAKNVSTINNTLKAYMAWKYGVIQSTEGNFTFEVEPTEAFAAALGIPLGEEADLSAKMDWLANRKENKEEIVNILRQYRIALANDWGDRERIRNEVKAVMMLIPPELVDEVLADVYKFDNDLLYESVSKSIEEKKRKDEYARKVRKQAEEAQK